MIQRRLLTVKWWELEYQQNNFILQFCPAYNFPIWLHAFDITSADLQLMSADVIWSQILMLYLSSTKMQEVILLVP